MNKINFFIVLFLALTACSKTKDAVGDQNQKDSTSTKIPKTVVSINEAIFTDPELTNSKKSDTQIMDSLVKYLDHSPRGSAVHISIYLFTYDPVIQAAKRAAERGVDVRVLITGSRDAQKSNQTAYNTLVNEVGPENVVWVFSDAAPFATEAINHEKYVLFSEINLPKGVAKNVVFATSHNFIKSGTTRAQDAIVMSNKGLYNAFLDNWNEVLSKAASGMKDFTYESFNVGDSITAFFFPRRKEGSWDGKNTIIEQLDKLSDYSVEDTVRVLMSSWSGGSGQTIAERLVELADEGVTVQVIAKDSYSSTLLTELKKLNNKATGYLKIINTSTQGEHSKTMLIKGSWNGQKNQKIILTGSFNYTSYALKYNNEFLLRLKNSTLFDDYWANWNKVDEIY